MQSYNIVVIILYYNIRADNAKRLNDGVDAVKNWFAKYLYYSRTKETQKYTRREEQKSY